MYQSLSTPNHIYKNAANYAVELVFQNEAAQKGTILPPFFWRLPGWKSRYTKYITIIKRTINLTSDAAVLAAIRSQNLHYLSYQILLFHAKKCLAQSVAIHVELLPNEEIKEENKKEVINIEYKPSFKDFMK